MTILFEKNENGLARITLNRPEKHNAFNEEMISNLSEVFWEIGNSDDIKVLILSGAGKSFSAGADLDWMKRAAEFRHAENLIDAQKLSDMLHALYSLKILTIADVKGAIMGGGLGLVSCVDIVVAHPESRFALSEVKLGLIPSTISPYVIKAIGSRQAGRYFQTAEFFSAYKAMEIGLVHEVSSDTEIVINSLLENISKNAPLAMQEAKRLVLDYDCKVISDELRADSAKRIADTRASEEAKEGLEAFFEKRRARWVKDV